MNDDDNEQDHGTGLPPTYIVLTLLLMAAMGGLSWFGGGGAALAFTKALVIPVFVMASAFIGLHFDTEAARTPWSAAFFQRHALAGITYAAVMAVFFWTPARDLVTTVLVFLAMAVFFGGGTAVASLWSSRK